MTTHTDLIARLRYAEKRAPNYGNEMLEAADAIEALEQQVAALRVDAERYQILRRGQHWSVINGVGDELRADQLDAAIDAAMGEM